MECSRRETRCLVDLSTEILKATGCGVFVNQTWIVSFLAQKHSREGVVCFAMFGIYRTTTITYGRVSFHSEEKYFLWRFLEYLFSVQLEMINLIIIEVILSLRNDGRSAKLKLSFLQYKLFTALQIIITRIYSCGINFFIDFSIYFQFDKLILVNKEVSICSLASSIAHILLWNADFSFYFVSSQKNLNPSQFISLFQILFYVIIIE